MLVSSYNNKAFSDLLTVQLKKSEAENQTFERKGDITKLVDSKSGETVGFNFHAASQMIKIDESGPIILSEEQVEAILEEAKNDSNYTLVKYSSTYKERKAQGEVVDYWYRLTLTKAFTDEKEPDRDVQITYGV